MKHIGVFLVLTLFCLTSMQAQQHRERWKATDYFPEHHFVSTYDSSSYEDRAGDVAFYMRLAGLKPWQDTYDSREAGITPAQYWTKLDYTIDEHTLAATYYPIQGNQKLSKREYRKLMSLFAALNFDNKPRREYWPMTDGAQWVIERRTADTFKASFTNIAGEKYGALYSYLIQLAGIDADYASKYWYW